MSEFGNNPPKTVTTPSASTLDLLLVPDALRDERAFIRSGLGQEIAPGRFVMTQVGFHGAYYLSQVSDPVFQSVLRDNGYLNSAKDLTDAQWQRIFSAYEELRERVVVAAESGVIPVAPLPMHPGPNADKSPLLKFESKNATTVEQLTNFAAMRYVVRDGNIIIPNFRPVSYKDILIAETVAQMQAWEDAVPLLQSTLRSLIRGLAAAGKPEAADVLAKIPRHSPGIAAALFFAHTAVKDSSFSFFIQLGGVLRGIKGNTHIGVSQSDWMTAWGIARECLDAAKAPAEATMQAIKMRGVAQTRGT